MDPFTRERERERHKNKLAAQRVQRDARVVQPRARAHSNRRHRQQPSKPQHPHHDHQPPNNQNDANNHQKQVLSTLGCIKGKRVLELGAGIGRFTGEIAKTAAHVRACDFMEVSISENRRRNGHLPNVEFEVADVTQFEAAEGSYDVVFSNWLLMYLSDEEVAALMRNALGWVSFEFECLDLSVFSLFVCLLLLLGFGMGIVYEMRDGGRERWVGIWDRGWMPHCVSVCRILLPFFAKHVNQIPPKQTTITHHPPHHHLCPPLTAHRGRRPLLPRVVLPPVGRQGARGVQPHPLPQP